MTYFCEAGKSSDFSMADAQLLKVCFRSYHGACGPYKAQLYKILIPMIDRKQTGLIQYLASLFPLLSSVGGGGQNGVKHTMEWGSMVMKIVHECYESMYSLYNEIMPSLAVSCRAVICAEQQFITNFHCNFHLIFCHFSMKTDSKFLKDCLYLRLAIRMPTYRLCLIRLD